MKIVLVILDFIPFKRRTSQLKDNGYHMFLFDSLRIEGRIKDLD